MKKILKLHWFPIYRTLWIEDVCELTSEINLPNNKELDNSHENRLVR